MKVAIRADAGLIQGSGHVMRCKTLAEKLLSLGSTVTFYSNIQGIPWLDDSIAAMNIEVISVEKNELAITELVAKKFDLVVVDSYELPVDKINELAAEVPVLAIVDEPNPYLRVHAVLDQNLGAEIRHVEPYADGTLTLLGSKFALVRNEFLKIRINAPKRVKRIEDSRMLCFFGGSDPSRAAIEIASVFRSRARPHLTILAPEEDHKEIRQILGDTNLDLLTFTTKLPSLIEKSDTVISAAGTSAWDLASIGVPSAFVSIASNQDLSLSAIHANKIGVTLNFQDSEEFNYEKICELIESQKIRAELFQNMQKNFDGMGSERACNAVIESIQS